MMLKDIWKATEQKAEQCFQRPAHTTQCFQSVFFTCVTFTKVLVEKFLNRNNTKHCVLGIWPGAKGEGGDPNKTHQQGLLGVNQYIS